MISREDVVSAYRLLFGREPENEAVVNHYATEVSSLKALRELFMNSAEFRESVDKALGPRPPRTPFRGPRMHVETTSDAGTLMELVRRTSAQWQHLGETEPHWSVVTNESYFQENFQMNREAFYATGESELKMFEAALERAGIAHEGLGVCLELGCGVGRVTASLASRFDRIVAVDISTSHLRLADEYLREKGISNVECRHLGSVDDIPRLGKFDVVYSMIVLQHNPPPVMAAILRSVLAQLNPDGVAFIQVPTYRAGYEFRVNDYLKQMNFTKMEMHCLPQAALFDLLMEQNCRIMEFREDDAIGLSVTAISNTFLIQKRRTTTSPKVA